MVALVVLTTGLSPALIPPGDAVACACCVIAIVESHSYGLYMAGGLILPDRKRVVLHSIQWLKRLKPALFRQDLITLLDLLKQQKIRPLIAQRFPLAEARRAHELLGEGGVTGKSVLVRDLPPAICPLESRS
jgi:NADPH:quinone reductase-like Zn-dependent oxidoreductase